MMMRRNLDRLISLLRRYRVDRRLPPPVSALVRDVIGLRTRDRLERFAASARVPWASSSTDGEVARLAGRLLTTDGPLDVSFDEVRHRFARDVLDRLEAVGIEAFAVDRRGQHLVFGLSLVDRPLALRAVAEGQTDHWYLEYDTGSSTRLIPVRRAASSRAAGAARAWRIFRASSWGARAVGADQAVELTFWELGSSGQLEMVGTRGHERFDQRAERTVEVIEGRRYPGRAGFAVGSSLQHDDAPVDIVYTWVDGGDPSWRAEFERWSKLSGRDLTEGAFEEGRFRSRDELRYSLRSVWAFAGWVRNIYIVTAGQRPEWLADHPRVTVVDHADILPADALPTFNSHAIESALHRIDGLAEQFIYFNDDVFLGRPVRPETFFTSNGLPLVFLSGARHAGFVDSGSLDVDRAAERGRQLLERRFGRVAATKPYHTAFPLLRSVLEEIGAEFPDIVKQTAHSRFRAASDLSIAASFGQHYSLATQRGVLGVIRNEYVHVESDRLQWHLDRIRLGRDFDTICINETERRAHDQARRERSIREFFEEYFPIAAPWESPGRGDPRPST